MKNATELIVLATTKIGESSIVLHTLSRDYGRRSFVANVGKKTGAAALYLPLNILEADIYENPKSSLWRASGISAVEPLSSIRSSVHKNSMTLFMSEVLYRAIREEAVEPGLFEWCKKAIITLDALDSDFSNFHLRFLMELCITLGFRPEAADMAPFAGGIYADVEQFLKAGFAESMLLPLTGQRRNEMAEVLLKYLSHHLECNLNIRSLAVLRELYA